MHGAWLAAELELGWGPVIQGFGNDRIDGLNKWRWPEFEEFRWNVFSAIAGAGARAIVPWLVPARPEVWLDDPEDRTRFLKNVVAPVYGELREIRHAMETGYNVGRIEVAHVDEVGSAWDKVFERISGILLHDATAHRYFLILTNNDWQEHHVRITLSELPVELAGRKATVLRTGESVALEELGGATFALQDRIGHHQAVIYSLAAVPAERLEK